MFLVNFIALILLFVVVDTIFVALFRRQRGGKFKVRTLKAGRFTFTSNFGRFNFDYETKSFAYRDKGKLVLISADDIVGIEHKVSSQFAIGSELFFGLSIFDFIGQNFDLDFWHQISIRTKLRGSVPVFCIGQYQPREFLLNWYISLQAEFLKSLGLFAHADVKANFVQRKLQSALREIGAIHHLLKPE